MSFGIDDNWIDPDDDEDVSCEECVEWVECPCGCEYGWCKYIKEFTKSDDEC